MGQSASRFRRSKGKFTSPVLPDEAEEDEPYDYTCNLPDECVSLIFQSLTCGADRKRCSLVCRRWLKIEGQCRHRLSLKAQSDLISAVPSLFSRFDSVTKLVLRSDRRSLGISDDAFVMISVRCRNLTQLKLRACREISDLGMVAFSKNCRGLKKVSFGSCGFGVKGMNALLNNSLGLEELSVKRLRGINAAAELIGPGPGAAAGSLKMICLKELHNGQCFAPLLSGAKGLRTLKISRCSGDWDRVFEEVGNQVNVIVEIHLERIQMSDLGLTAISKCSGVEILHLVKTPDCTNIGLALVAEGCKLLRKLHIDGWKTNRIGDDGLIVVANSCWNLQELVLIGVNPTNLSLEALASNCLNLERLALCGSDTVGDTELRCIAEKCLALKKLCVKNCPITDDGIQAFGTGCPNLVKVKVKKCRGVTNEGADRLRTRRALLVVNLDIPETPIAEASASEGGAQVDAVDSPPFRFQIPTLGIASGSTSRSTSLKSRLGFLSRRNLVACALTRLGSRSSSQHD
ncbi:PREDICTED: putative F-box/LRR-repeat protein 8 [Camelina sativa]|uniref:F-box/LRR-repeat protein 8 n=1 Tax=Camelina sativa TaxID=90675 RepID=A0ABM0T6S4_CAMSA|nr:PREDICTED: putative F-box/LRR-repeat protein 8 [Camelina sativa]